MTIDPLEIARQMTLIEFSIYEKIQAKECIGQAWNGKKKHIVSPNISAVIAFTNQISAWVATKILESEDIRVRYSILKYFVTVAKCCYDMNNFNTSNAILAAMESSPVHRLKKTWEAFNSDKKNKAIAYYGFSFSFFLFLFLFSFFLFPFSFFFLFLFLFLFFLLSFSFVVTLFIQIEQMTTIFSPKGNYSNYRKHLHTINPPVSFLCQPILKFKKTFKNKKLKKLKKGCAIPWCVFDRLDIY